MDVEIFVRIDFLAERKMYVVETVTFFVLNVGDAILIALNFKKIFVLL